MMFYLCEFDVDGFRCDYCDGIPEEFWIEAKNRMNAIKPDAVLIEEGSKKERLTTCFNAIYCFSWHEDLYKLLLGKIIDAFKVRNTYESFKKGLPLNSLVLRDLENHDTVTDWPIRCDLVAGYSAMDIMLVLNYVIDGVPLIYCGNEIADTSNVNLFANRFFPGVYEATDRSIKNQPYSLKRQALIKRLNALRYESKALQSGNTEWIDNSKPENTLSFVREYNGEKLLFVGNFSDKNIRVKLELESFVGQIIMENKTFIHNDYTIELNSYGYLILKM
jgi:cyclomaltodextrinase